MNEGNQEGFNDADQNETQEWLDSLSSVLRFEGAERAKFIIEQLLDKAQQVGLSDVSSTATPHINTIPKDQEPVYPGDLALEKKIESAVRWNAVAMVEKANNKDGALGGHLSSAASMATAYEVAQNHFFKGDETGEGDLVYFQGHSSEAIYARSFLEGRLSEQQLTNFRQEALTNGLSSYPHAWLMPDYWQFATVSLGLGPVQAVYQAQFLKYLQARGLVNTEGRKVWCFIGDGEMDESYSTASITLAGREKLDNLIRVLNCNLQRLDGLVRSNYSVIDEYERLFKGAGWNVIKVCWGEKWDALFAKDTQGKLQKRFSEIVDGDLQTYVTRGGAYTREHFFNVDPDLAGLVADLSDDEIAELNHNRGAHDAQKIYAAFDAAVKHKGEPTLILLHGIKGYGLAGAVESKNIAHVGKKITPDQLKSFRDRFDIPLDDDKTLNYKFYKLEKGSDEEKYLLDKRKQLNGYLPSRRTNCDESLPTPDISEFDFAIKDSGDREVSTTMILSRIISTLCKDKQIGKRIVPIFSDEVRSFGMDALFSQLGVYDPKGQLYTPEDREQLMYYREAKDGQLLELGITEAGCMASWIAAGTAYSTLNFPMIPIFCYYSMFGMQREADLCWAAGDMRVRGFLFGCTAGRTTLAGEGLQHTDGQTPVIASMNPNCVAYDPCFAYELAVIVHEGLRRMYTEKEDVYFYVMAMNEKYQQPQMPKDSREGILKGMYLYQQSDQNAKHKVQLLGSGAILREAIAAAELLAKDFDVQADVWSVTSFTELRRDGLVIERQNMLNADKKAKLGYVGKCLAKTKGPVVAASDYVKTHADLIRPFIDRTYVTLGTDGFGRSDSRGPLREFFEVNRFYIAVAALYALSKDGEVPASSVKEAMKKYKIDPAKPDPTTV